MLKAIIDILFPEYCLLCGKPGSLICDYCDKKLIPSLPECYKCRRLSSCYRTHTKCLDKYSLSSVFWAWQYNSLSSKFIKTLKYKGASSISDELTDLLVKRIKETKFLQQFEDPLLVPIPLHKKKERERGFNQAFLIGELISKKLNIPIDNNLLFRQIYSRAQAEKDKTQRKFLSEETFVFDINRYENKYHKKDIILIDDVITTGTTLDMAGMSIKTINKDISVSSVCLFRGKPDYSSESSSTCLIS